MTNPSFSRRLVRQGAVCAGVASLAVLVAVGALKAADDTVSESLRRNENGQQQVQTQAQDFAAQLRAMSAEFDRNGLTGDSVKMLDLLSKAVGTMSEQDMTRIIGLLRQARTLNDKTAVLQQVAAAYAGQKSVTVQMKGLLARYQKDQVAADVAATLAKLAERQAANFQAGVDVAQWTDNKSDERNKDPESAQEALKAAVDMQSSEQAALRDEARMATDRLQNAARDKSDPAAAARAQTALDQLKALDHVLDQAADDLKNGHLFKAVVNEKAARDAMRQLARELTPIKANDADALRQASREVDEMVTQQKEMLKETEAASHAAPDLEHWLQKELANPKSEVNSLIAKKEIPGRTVAELKEEKAVKDHYGQKAGEITRRNEQALGSLENKANDVANRGDDVRQNLQANAAEASAAVKAAEEKMQAARADLDDHNAAAALQDQQTALAEMQQAQKQIQAKLAAEEQAANVDRTTQLQAIKQQGKELAAEQNAAEQQQALQPQAASNNAAQEAALRKKADDLQAKAAQAQSPAAAAALQNAAGDMEKAAAALAQPTGQAQAQAAETAAQGELAKADAALDKDIAGAATAQQEVKQVDQIVAALDQLIAGQEKVQAATTLLASGAAPAAKKDANGAKPPPVSTAGELARQQLALKDGTAALVPMLSTPELQPAALPLETAQSAMDSAHSGLARANASAAAGPERMAIVNLLEAKQILDKKKDELEQQADPSAADQQAQKAAQTAAQQIAQAQDQAQQAQQQLAQQQSQSAQDQQQKNSAQSQSAQSQSAKGTSSQGSSSKGSASQQAGQDAQQELNNAANLAGQAAAADPGAMSAAMQQELKAAQDALNAAAAAAAKGDAAGAQAEAQKAQDALAQAQAQAAQAQAGLAQASDQAGGQPPPGGGPQAGQPPGASGGKPPGPPSGKPGQGPGGKPSESAQTSTETTNLARDARDIGQGNVVKGSRETGKQSSAFSALPPRDRAALQQSQAEKSPAEYGSMIEQYMQNLADQPGS